MTGRKIRKVISIFSFILGFLTFMDGLPILFQINIPDHSVINWLLYYNLLMAAVTIAAGAFFWRGEKLSIQSSGILAIGHTIVMMMILTVFADSAAAKSQIAMTVRSITWIVIFILSLKNRDEWFA
ncbi:MAG TPA: hypothetical protein ENN33_05410 [Ignavibacteria bacterium]|nr:hypothetical protein [Ignavibacteria bacterium]